MALLQTLLPWVNVAGSRQGETAQAQRNAVVFAAEPGLQGFLEQHGVQLGDEVSQEDRNRLAELVQQYFTQRDQQQ